MTLGAPVSQPDLWYVRKQTTVASIEVSLAQWHAWSISQAHWVKDAHRSQCYSCEQLFTFFRRKQHCRMCGEIICRHCSQKLCLITKQLRHKRKNGTSERHIKVCPSCLTSSIGSEKALMVSPRESSSPMDAPFFACTPKIPILEDMSTSNNSTCASGSSFMEDIESLYVQTNEQARLQTLWRLHILDTPPEATYDTICTLLSNVSYCPMAYISFMDAHRQWFKARVGIVGTELPREASLCNATLHARAPIVVEDTTQDSRFAQNPLVACQDGIRFYGGAAIILSSGMAIGTVAVMDTSFNSRRKKDAIKYHLKKLAKMVATYCDRPRPLSPHVLLEKLLRQTMATKELLSSTRGMSSYSTRPASSRTWSSISEEN